mmetsp:Transcript_24631/g.43753  ORF Transcript_24631/g.43753 Transcript_24631/m.43753 type:complete len:261 (+) Transcript_24631:3785-4567(+)
MSAWCSEDILLTLNRCWMSWLRRRKRALMTSSGATMRLRVGFSCSFSRTDSLHSPSLTCARRALSLAETRSDGGAVAPLLALGPPLMFPAESLPLVLPLVLCSFCVCRCSAFVFLFVAAKDLSCWSREVSSAEITRERNSNTPLQTEIDATNSRSSPPPLPLRPAAAPELARFAFEASRIEVSFCLVSDRLTSARVMKTRQNSFSTASTCTSTRDMDRMSSSVMVQMSLVSPPFGLFPLLVCERGILFSTTRLSTPRIAK